MLRASYVTVFLLLGLIIASAPVAASAEINLLYNYSFELDLTSWQYSAGGECYQVGVQGGEGSRYAVLEVAGESGVTLYQVVSPARCAQSLEFYYLASFEYVGSLSAVVTYSGDVREGWSLDPVEDWTRFYKTLDTTKPVTRVEVTIATKEENYGELLVDRFDLEACLTVVSVDIKPGGYPNSINMKSKGVVPVAVLSTGDFDASTVDPSTVKLTGASPVQWTLKDVNGDGLADLVLQFKTQDLYLTSEIEWTSLIGATYGGTLIWGTDTVNIVK